LFPQEEIRTFGHNSEVNSVAFSPDGRYLATGARDKTAKLWEVSTGGEIRTFTGHSSWVHSVAFSPDGKYLATGSLDNTAKLWEVATGREIRTFTGHNDMLRSVAFSPDGKYIATGSNDKTAKLWEVATGKEIRTFRGHNHWVSSVTFSPDGKYLATSPDGKYLATGSLDNTAKLWEVATGKEIRTFLGHNNYILSVTFSPDGKYLATGSEDKTAKLWEVATGREIRTFRGHNDWVYSVAFSPDGKYLTTGSKDCTAKLWEVATGKEIRTFRGHTNSVWSVAFSPDGQYLATGSWDGTAKLWGVPSKIALIIASREVRLDSLKTEHEKKLAELFAPRGEFETTQQYQQRLKNAEQQKAMLTNLYQQKRSQIKQYYDQQIQSEIAQSRKNVTLSHSGTLGRYNIDKQVFPFKYKNQTYEMNVPLNQAPDFKNRFETFIIEGERQLNVKGDWEYFNYALVDPQRGARYPFGEQRGVTTATIAQKPTLPPRLQANLSFTEPSGEGFLDAGEKGTVTVELSNSGQGDAVNLIAELKSMSESSGIYFEIMKNIAQIKPNEKKSLTFTLEASDNLPTGTLNFEVKFSEANGFEPEPINFSLETHALRPPEIVIADFAVRDQSGNGKIEQTEPATLTLRLHNRGTGTSHASKAVVQFGANVFPFADSPTEFSLGNIPPGGIKDVEFTFYTNNRVQDKIPINLRIDDARPQFQKTLALDLQVNVPQKSLEQLTFKGTEKTSVATETPSLSVDIEQNIPQVQISKPDAIAVVIGNRDYTRVKNVEFAIRDAEYVKDYLVKMLGYKEGNILFIKNASKADFEACFGTKDNPRGRLADLVKSGKSEVFIYYSGHGAPGLKTHEGYFVPVDCDPQRVELTGYPLDVFYNNLAQIPAQNFTVVIDACFSGTNIYENISPIMIEILAPEAVLPNGIVFTSAGPQQVSAWYNEKFHSLFTYFFLKGLHNYNADLNKDRQITYQELYQYLNDQNEGVPYWARRLHGVEQTPVFFGTRQDEVLIKY
jgi:glucose/arabinose dehydrogenase